MKAARYEINDAPMFVIDQSRCIGCEACVQACAECGAPLESIWQTCPYCATPVPPAAVIGAKPLPPVQSVRPRRDG